MSEADKVQSLAKVAPPIIGEDAVELMILIEPHYFLHQVAETVRGIDSSIVQRIINSMVRAMHQVHGAGLAAPQIGVLSRIVVIEVTEGKTLVLINPEIIERSGERVVEEGCLSVPGYRGMVKRSEKVTVKALNRRGRLVRIKGEGLLAQALEHELDHLDGVLFTDKVEQGTLRKLDEQP